MGNASTGSSPRGRTAAPSGPVHPPSALDRDASTATVKDLREEATASAAILAHAAEKALILLQRAQQGRLSSIGGHDAYVPYLDRLAIDMTVTDLHDALQRYDRTGYR